MSELPISTEAKQLIARSIYSIEQLEVFLLLGKDAQRLYTPAEIFRVIKTNEASITRCLELFVRDGLATAQSDGRFQFAADARLLEVASELAQAYRERSVAVIGMIYNKPDQQMRSFANAFRFRKES
ncbi:MAG TPA: hypothetical protein VFZ59_15860 [Verrucomicrobiae bacterium]|nr:hypothetical protein [Verrucomicrobiae bacterium]